MTRIYFDEDYLEGQFGEQVISGCLVYGGTSISVTGSALSNVISASCDYMDSIFARRGYSVPLAGEIPSIVKRSGAQIAMYYLFERVGIEAPESIVFMATTADGWLARVRDGFADIPGIKPTTPGASQGGHVVGKAATDSTSLSNASPWSNRRLKNIF